MIEEMLEEDLDAVLEIEEEVFTSRWTREQFLYELNENEFSHLYVVREDDKVIAYAGLWTLFERAEITTIAVSKTNQGRGYGKKLLKHLLRIAIANNCDICSLEVRPSNLVAIGLYESLGFEKLRIRKDYYTDNHEDAIEMLKAIGGLNEEDFSD